MINTAHRFAKGDETARDPMINRDGRFVKGDEIARDCFAEGDDIEHVEREP